MGPTDRAPICPVCAASAALKLDVSPYWICPGCDLWFQSPLPPKTFEGEHEQDGQGHSSGHLMEDYEKRINRDLAAFMFERYVCVSGKKTLDIGSKYPYLAHCLKHLGCEAYGLDNIDAVPDYSKALDVPMILGDFENKEWSQDRIFSFITMIHVFEHMYDPVNALRKLRALLTDDGALWIRMPDHGVRGFERDLVDTHYKIHPYYHGLTSLLEAITRAGNALKVVRYQPMDGAGQSDVVLRPRI